MSNSICSRDGCPMENVKKDRTTNCFVCKSIVHLMCIGIDVTKDACLWSKHIKIICNQCLISEFSPDAKRKQRTSVKNSQLNSHQQAISNFINSPITSHTKTPFQQNQGNNEILQTIQNIVTQNNKALTEIKSKMDVSGKNINEIKEANISFADIMKSQQKDHSSKFQNRIRTLSSKLTPIVPKRTKVIRETELSSGTNSIDNHDLGDKVKINPTKKYQQLPKAIYVSRLQPSVNVEKMSAFICKQLPNIKTEDFSLRLLVKADQKLDELNFVSFRLSCTDELYEILYKPEFWPQHVLIGEFISKNIQKEAVNIITSPSINHHSPAIKTSQNFLNSQTNQNTMEKSK